MNNIDHDDALRRWLYERDAHLQQVANAWDQANPAPAKPMLYPSLEKNMDRGVDYHWSIFVHGAKKTAALRDAQQAWEAANPMSAQQAVAPADRSNDRNALLVVLSAKRGASAPSSTVAHLLAHKGTLRCARKQSRR